MINEYLKSTNIYISAITITVLDEYLLCLKLENKAVTTITNYKWILERFLRECKFSLKDYDLREG
ncbi:MAG TPA: hypothetical protein DEB37_04010 [Lysinibacillus sp.]|nr:hypothetical protein [Lysinibacillus sp.]